MTTLPQTSALRFPKAGGQSQLAVQPGPVMAPQAVAGSQLTIGDLWRIVRSNLWLVIVLVILTATGGFFLEKYLERTSPVYKATGMLRITPPQSSDPLHPTPRYTGYDMAALQIEQSTEVRLIKSEDLFQKVLADKDSKVVDTDWFKVTCGGDFKKAIEKLGTSLSVTPEATSPQLIDLSMQAGTPGDALVIAQAIGERAMSESAKEDEEKTNSEYKAIQERKDKNDRDIEYLKGRIADLEADLVKDGADPGGGMGTRMAVFAQLFQRQLDIRDRKNAAANALSAFDDSVKAGATPPAVQTMIAEDNDLLTLNRQISNLEQEMQTVRSGTAGPESPVLKNMQNELGQLQTRADRLKEVKKADFEKTMHDQLAAQQASTQQQYDEAVKSVAEAQAKNAEMSNKVDQLRSLEELKRIAQAFDDEAKKKEDDLTGLINQNDKWGTMKWAAEPRMPENRQSPNMVTTMSGAIAVGLFLSIGIAFLREVTDTTVRSPRDIARVGQLNLLGMISHEQDDPQSSGVRLPLIIFEAPQSIIAEQLRQARTRLQHTASLDTTRTLLITSPNPGDGKSTLAVNLAAGLALNGRRILLVDSNFRRPELHRIFGVGNDVGFSDALNDVAVFATAVRETPVPNLSVMASGPKPSNPTELIESQLMLDFIERALEEYDHVIFDSGPMLFVSESVALAPRVDGVVTVVRARTSSRGVLTRMRDMLRAVKAEHLGVILNGVRTQAGGYYAKNIQSYYKYQSAE